MAKARVDSLEVLKSFRAALWKFSETAMAALAEAEGEVHRTLIWLETEQLIFWQNEIRKRHDWVEKCKEAYRQKTLFKDAAGRRSTGFDERKALDKAKKSLEESEEKHEKVRRYTRILQKELQNFAGSVQRFSTDVMTGLPNAIAKLEMMQGQLEAYVNLSVPTEVGGGNVTPGESMGRGDTQDAATKLWHTPVERVGEVVESANFLATANPLSGPNRLAIAMLGVKRNVPVGGNMVAISADLKHGQNLYLHRTESRDAADSGWFVGPADREEIGREVMRISVDHLLETRPDWREILSLPVDFVVVIGAGSITNVYNRKGEDVWLSKRS